VAVIYFVNRGSKVYYSLIDASKAFDKALLNDLFPKLIESGVPI